jgi:signal peptidase I
VTSEDRGAAAAVDDGAVPRSSRPGRKHLPLWQETALLLVLALVLAVVIKALFIQAFYIPSESMEPGLIKNDRILVEKPSYWFGDGPSRGDVVVFKDPGGWLTPAESAGPANPVAKLMAKVGLYPEGGHLVKRVIGVAGDTITCCDDKGRIEVNGYPLKEDYLKEARSTECNGPMTNTCDWTVGPVPKGHIFVMGDHRDRSADSTVHMCGGNEKVTDCTDTPFIDVDEVVGKVFVLLWPASRLDWITRPDVFSHVPDPS